MTYRFNAQIPPFDSLVELRMIHKDENGRRSAAQPIQMVEQDHTARTVEPFLRLELSEAQELIDCLWAAGLRPTDGRGSAGALAATERHLSDMQKMAFQLLNKGG